MKTAAQAMNYEVSGSKKVNGKGTALKMANQLGTPSLVWLIVKRHKVGLLVVGNVILLANWIFPAWPSLVLGLIGK